MEALKPPVRTSIPYFGLSMHHDRLHKPFVNLYLAQFAKLRKAAVSFVAYVFPHGTTRLPLGGFS